MRSLHGSVASKLLFHDQLSSIHISTMDTLFIIYIYNISHG